MNLKALTRGESLWWTGRNKKDENVWKNVCLGCDRGVLWDLHCFFMM